MISREVEVVLEAKNVASRKCLETSRSLYKYLSENSANILGDKGAALSQLPHIKWVEAALREDPGRGDEATASMSLEAPSQLFPAESLKLVWAVRDTLSNSLPMSPVAAWLSLATADYSQVARLCSLRLRQIQNCKDQPRFGVTALWKNSRRS